MENKASRLSEERYPECQQPHHASFTPINRRLKKSGELRPHGSSGLQRTVRTVQFEEGVLQLIVQLDAR